jgi:hypothetical protein
VGSFFADPGASLFYCEGRLILNRAMRSRPEISSGLSFGRRCSLLCMFCEAVVVRRASPFSRLRQGMTPGQISRALNTFVFVVDVVTKHLQQGPCRPMGLNCGPNSARFRSTRYFNICYFSRPPPPELEVDYFSRIHSVAAALS